MFRPVRDRQRKDYNAVRIFKAFPQKDEECRALCAADSEQRPEDDLEAVWIRDAWGAAEPDFCSHALYHGAVPEGGTLHHG